MYQVTHDAYCGMTFSVPTEDKASARIKVAKWLRRAKRKGFPVAIVARGECWEVMEPEECAMVPDACGTIHLQHLTAECRECGTEIEDPEERYCSPCCAAAYNGHSCDCDGCAAA